MPLTPMPLPTAASRSMTSTGGARDALLVAADDEPAMVLVCAAGRTGSPVSAPCFCLFLPLALGCCCCCCCCCCAGSGEPSSMRITSADGAWPRPRPPGMTLVASACPRPSSSSEDERSMTASAGSVASAAGAGTSRRRTTRARNWCDLSSEMTLSSGSGTASSCERATAGEPAAIRCAAFCGSGSGSGAREARDDEGAEHASEGVCRERDVTL